METWLIYVMFDILMGNSYPFLLENTFVTSDESEYFSILSQKAQNDVMSTWTLSTIETDTNPNFFCLFTLLECDNLMTLLW